MHNYWIFYICIFLAGLVSGFFSHLFEIGGIIRIPILYVLFLLVGVDDSILMHTTIGTSLAISLPASLHMFLRQYRFWRVDYEGEKITFLLKRWLPSLLVGGVLGIGAAKYVSSSFLAGIFIVVVLWISIQAFVMRQTSVLMEKFPNFAMFSIVAFVTGTISVLSGTTNILVNSVMRAFAYPGESSYMSAASGMVLTVVATIGYAVIGLGVAGRTPYSVGYIDVVAVFLCICGMFIASRIGAKTGNPPWLNPFKKFLTDERDYDQLTGLHSAKRFDEMLSYLVKYASRGPFELSLLIIDADNLTSVNRKYGQKFANGILETVAGVLKETLGESDIASRMGGYGSDEFGVILPGVGKSGSIALAEVIKEKFMQRCGMLEYGDAPVSLSIGICLYPNDGADKDALVKRAEEAMLKSKNNGKNRITHYEDTLVTQDA